MDTDRYLDAIKRLLSAETYFRRHERRHEEVEAEETERPGPEAAPNTK
ncbi:hypothetical protein MSAS_23010 [Mycobacterium saskatchewanense]|nr:hypothetical protein [Mycobacterium saskatchewanense]BBX63127.1 hypothetical protein MSAS_23010 [Mycobacterium saskatchewanense]